MELDSGTEFWKQSMTVQPKVVSKVRCNKVANSVVTHRARERIKPETHEPLTQLWFTIQHGPQRGNETGGAKVRGND
jgi:hypothetical protein